VAAFSAGKSSRFSGYSAAAAVALKVGFSSRWNKEVFEIRRGL